jgi:SSS family transporter
MHPIDWLVVLFYFVFIIAVGLRTGRGNREIEDYFLAKRSMPWWAIGLSVMATQASAITLVGTTGQAYVDGMRFIQIYLALPFAMVILCVTLVPFFYRARVFTAYEFLEKRFDGKTRSLTSFLFLLSRGLADAVVIYAPSVVLSIVFGLDEKVIILAIGLGATVYTAFGGMRAVMWTEVWQMLIIFLGMLFCLGSVVVGLPDSLSLGSALRIVGSTGRLTTIDFNPDPAVTYTFWSGLIGGLFLMLSYFGADQSQVQRYLTARSLSQSRLSLL